MSNFLTQVTTLEYQALSLRVAMLIAEQLKAKPESCLGLPSGRSPLGCYRLLSQWSQAGKIDWSSASCFSLDDYLDVDENQTFANYLATNLYQQTNLLSSRQFNPRFVDNYDALIADCGGLDLALIGLGGNGHIAFNEPGTPRLSWSHCLWLSKSTIEANAGYFADSHPPLKAVTMGVETILRSRKIILIACGGRKKEVLQKALSGPTTSDLPASFLQEHSNLAILADFTVL